MITLYAESKLYGNEKQYIARITGRDSKFTFAREFCGRKSGRSSEANIDDPGLYELGNVDKKGNRESIFRVVVATGDKLVALKAGGDNADNLGGDDAAMQISKRLGNGEAIADIVELVPSESGDKYRIRTKAQASKAAKASTINSVTDECWALLQNLPDKEVKAVLASLKLRVSPKPAAIAVAEIPTVEGDAQ